MRNSWHCEFTVNDFIVYFRTVNIMVCKLYLKGKNYIDFISLLVFSTFTVKYQGEYK